MRGGGCRRAGCGECQRAVEILWSPEWLLARQAEKDLLPWPRAGGTHAKAAVSTETFWPPLSKTIPIPSNERNLWKLNGTKMLSLSVYIQSMLVSKAGK